jgi:serine protease
MRRWRPALFCLGIPLAALAFSAGPLEHGLAQTISPLDVVAGVGLPGIDRGPSVDESRIPDSPANARRHGLRTNAVVRERVDPFGSHVLTDRVIVKFRDGLPVSEHRAAVALISAAATLEQPSGADFDVVQLAVSEDSEVTAQRLSQRADVEYAQPVHRLHTEFVPNDPLYKSNQWNLPLIDLERAWDVQPQAGSSIIVAVIDTGVAYVNATLTADVPAFTLDGTAYPALGRVTIPYSAASQLAPSSRFVAPRDFVCNSSSPLDFDGHGTHVSGTLGQDTNDGVGTAGVAFNVRIMPVKVIASTWDALFGCADSEGGTDDQVARGIRYAVDNGAKILNLSLGADGAGGSSPVLEAAIRYAVGKGAFVSVAAGNSYEDGNPMQVVAEIASRVDGAVSVAAVDPQRQHAFYSSSGSFVELAAPGGSSRGFGANGAIWQQTFDPNFSDTFLLAPGRFAAPRFDVLAYVPYQGTSQATPHVSGVAAMLMQQGIVDPAAIEKALEATATDLGTPGRDDFFGFGLVEARSALRGYGLVR